MNKNKLIPLMLAFCLIALHSKTASAADLKNSVLKLFVTSNTMDYYHPWQSRGNAAKTGSGVVIPGNRILTNAHVVNDHTFIQVRKVSDPKKYTAKVLAIGHDCDLALLTVEDPAFFEDVTPVEIGDLPALQESVVVLGYPTGGDKLSITEGVVSRWEITSYVQSARKLLTVQIDAAINPGNSGGPVIKNGKLVGIAMQGIVDSQNIGYMIPPPIINHFFKDLEDGEYDGFPLLGVDINNTENATLREYYKLKSDEKGGVLISYVMPGTASDGYLQEGDIVLSLDGVPIGVDGTFDFREGERLALSHLINEKQVGEKIEIEFLRDGRKRKLSVPIGKYYQLVPPPRHFEKPSYYIYGGLVFTVLSTDLLTIWGNQWWITAPLDFLYYYRGIGRLNTEKDNERVVLLEVLPDDVNVGYHGYSSQVISKVNGKNIKSFKDFVKALHNQKSKYTVIESEQKVKIILNNEDIQEKTDQILERNNIPFQYSEDVAEWIED